MLLFGHRWPHPQILSPNSSSPSGSFEKFCLWGARVPQTVECLTLGFGSGHDLTVHEIETRVGLRADRAEPARVIFSSLSASPPARPLSQTHK